MAKMKTKFNLQYYPEGKNRLSNSGHCISIIGQAPEHATYVKIELTKSGYYLKDKDLETFAVNILKALKSNRLNP